jgi:hypothetical protein
LETDQNGWERQTEVQKNRNFMGTPLNILCLSGRRLCVHRE